MHFPAAGKKPGTQQAFYLPVFTAVACLQIPGTEYFQCGLRAQDPTVIPAGPDPRSAMLLLVSSGSLLLLHGRVPYINA